MPQIIFETLGCRLNQIESESAARFFVDAGFSVSMTAPTAASETMGDVLVCVVNTCAVTQKAEQKARREIRLLLQKCPSSSVIVTGCYAALAADTIGGLASRVAVLPGLCKDRLADVPPILADFIETHENFCAEDFSTLLASMLFAGTKSHSGKAEASFRLATDTFLAHSRSSLKIQDGCDSACSYCAIRIARGKSVSLPVADALSRIASLKAEGQKEIVFTAVNIAQYRGEYGGAYYTFADLLEKALAETEGISFRISSMYPELVDDRFCRIVKDERVRPHFHLSVQSGSDRILASMNRSYCARDILRAVSMLRQAKGNAFFACDVIAGFPGETDEDFELTLELCRACAFAYVHAFPFSPRPGTRAFSMKPKVLSAAVRERVRRLSDFAVKNKTVYIESFRGTTVRAIAENAKEGDGAFYIRAVTENFIHCRVRCTGISVPKAGSDIRVRILASRSDSILKGDELEADAELVH